MAAPVDTAERAVGSLGGVFAGAVLRFVERDSGFELDGANAKAARMLATAVQELLGSGFAEGLFGQDADLLVKALHDPDRDREPVVLRWGSSPPVRFLGVELQRDSDGSVLAGFHDQTDQHRLDGVMAAQGRLAQIFDDEGYARWISARSAAAVGVRAGHHAGLHTSEIVHPDDMHIIERVDREMRAHPGSEIVAWYRVRHPTEPETWWNFRTTLIYLPDDPVIGGIVNVSRRLADVPGSDRAPGPAAMTVAEVTPSGLVFSARGRLQFRNGVARRMLGPAIDATDAYAWVEALRPEHRGPLLEALIGAADAGRNTTVAVAIDRAGEEALWLRIEVMPSFDAVGTQVGYGLTVLDVTAEHEARQGMQRTQGLLWQSANHDALTGLPNRMHFNNRLDQALARTRREGRSTALLFCDLDHFKAVNDQFGHAAGDAVLTEVGRRLSASIRETDTVSRIGGDEFVIVCEAFDDLADLEILAERLIAVVNEPVPWGDTAANVGLSVGIAVATPRSAADELMAGADTAAYQAKQNGRNGYVNAP